MGIFQIEDHVQRKGTHILVAMVGESGSGKTESALLIGRGLVGPQGKLLLLDTENGRGRFYAKSIPGGYGYASFSPPYTPERFVTALQEIEAAGVECCVIDTASHEWEGFGGVLDIAENGKSASGYALEGLVKWAKPKARHKAFMRALLDSQMHLIICLRAKEKLAQVTVTKDGKSKKEIVSQGLFPVQDKTFKFEMTVQLMMEAHGPQGGYYKVEKCPREIFHAFPSGDNLVGIEAGQALAKWIEGDTVVDKNLTKLVTEGNSAAERGKEAFASFWNRPDVKTHRDKLKPYLPNFQSIAEAAEIEMMQDEEMIEEELIIIDPVNPFKQEKINPPEDDIFPGDIPMKSV